MKVSDLLSMFDTKKLNDANYGQDFVEFIQEKARINSLTTEMTGVEVHDVLLVRLNQSDYFRVMDANFDPLNKNMVNLRTRKWYTNVTLVLSMCFALVSIIVCFAYTFQDEMLTPEFRESLKQTLIVLTDYVMSYFQ